MNTNYFSLPFDVKRIISNSEHNKCTIKESIANYIHLLTTSYFGECTFDDTFGCSVWDVDFDNLASVNKIKGIIGESLIESIKNHEKRLTKVAVDVMIRQEEVSDEKSANRIKKKVSIKIKGVIKKTNENFLFNEYFFIGPLSY